MTTTLSSGKDGGAAPCVGGLPGDKVALVVFVTLLVELALVAAWMAARWCCCGGGGPGGGRAGAAAGRLAAGLGRGGGRRSRRRAGYDQLDGLDDDLAEEFEEVGGPYGGRPAARADLLDAAGDDEDEEITFRLGANDDEEDGTRRGRRGRGRRGGGGAFGDDADDGGFDDSDDEDEEDKILRLISGETYEH